MGARVSVGQVMAREQKRGGVETYGGHSGKKGGPPTTDPRRGPPGTESRWDHALLRSRSPFLVKEFQFCKNAIRRHHP